MHRKSLICGLFGGLALSGSALAQTAADQQAVAYQAARNQLGVLMYCVDKGYVGAEIVDIQKKMIGMLPAPSDKSGGDAAQASGRKGTVAAMGITQELEAAAKAQGVSVQPLCSKIGEAVKQVGAMLPK